MEITSTHVSIPVTLFNRMADCYYGGGPRHNNVEERPGIAPRPDRPPSPPVSEEGSVGVDLAKLKVGRVGPPGFVPKGKLAPQTNPAGPLEPQKA